MIESFKTAFSICLGYLPVGIAFGVLARNAGLSFFESGLMSLVVFAGGSQFIIISLLAKKGSFLALIFTTFLVNFRHFLMSSALSVYSQKIPKKWLFLFAHGITDESFAINSTKFQTENWTWKQAIAVNQLTNLAWCLTTMLGVSFGNLISPGEYGTDYVLTAMFLCLIVFQLRGKKYVITAVVSGMLAVILKMFTPGGTYVIVASVIAATIGFFLETQFSKDKSKDA